MNFPHFAQWINQLSAEALKLQNRQLVILQGSEQWASSQLKQIIDSSCDEDSQTYYVYSDSLNIHGNVNKHTFKNKLGSESQFVVFYSTELNINALAALSGTLVAGGILFIVLPLELKSSDFFRSGNFNQRITNKIFNGADIQLLKETDLIDRGSSKILVKASLLNELNREQSTLAMGCITPEQVNAVEKIIHVVKGHRNKPLVLTADRGRGKSSALAIACAQLLSSSSSLLKIAITASHRHSLNVFFVQLKQTLKDNVNEENSNLFQHINGSVQFLAVDDLIKSTQLFNLVIVDEAAAIPLPFLSQLLKRYHRTVFSSTVHGYEGAGRSFSIKFTKNIKNTYPNSQFLHINQPIRWAENDPLECFINDVCLLNCELPKFNEINEINSQLPFEFEVISPHKLMNNEILLQQVFAILVTAHYQTSPSDLQLLLDNNRLTLVTLSVNQQLVGVALLLKEGVVKKDKQRFKSLIENNQRRLKDQFIPQSLLKHCGIENSFEYSYFRIMRIAIMPELQSKGLGSLFLNRIEKYAQQQNIDFIGASFGMNQPLLKFWQQQGYKIARVGFTKDKASGEYSGLLLKAINLKQLDFIDKIQAQFYQSFDYLLSEQYKTFEAKLVWQIMNACPNACLPLLSDNDLQTVEDFAATKRQYSVCVFNLHQWLIHQMLQPFDETMAPVIGKIFQKHDVATICEIYGFTGKKELNNHLINFTNTYYKI